MATGKAQSGYLGNKQATKPRNSKSRHCGTIHRRIVGALEGIQYRTQNPSWYQNDQWRLRAHFGSPLLKPRHPRAFIDTFLTGLPGRLIQEQMNDTRKQACTHPRVTKTMEQDSGYVLEPILVSRVDPDPKKGPPFAQKHSQRPF
ncbi:hypothetical protein CRG98_012618 [Punica granatum]|uniref:Uncharacterized protein n=1 Tax=Punica granatum TaxID=22663 RepID=A0A2I0KFJ9_PUNGR|nr:hypothetical protein CRG98_012618 [Punica granatum]